MARINPTGQRRPQRRWLWIMVSFMALGLMGAAGVTGSPAGESTGVQQWQPFAFWSDPAYTPVERVALLLNVVVALGGLVYAGLLVKQVYATDTGTTAMQEIARAIREGANAYLKRQFTTVGLLIVVITGVLIVTKWPYGSDRRPRL